MLFKSEVLLSGNLLTNSHTRAEIQCHPPPNGSYPDSTDPGWLGYSHGSWQKVWDYYFPLGMHPVYLFPCCKEGTVPIAFLRGGLAFALLNLILDLEPPAFHCCILLGC